MMIQHFIKTFSHHFSYLIWGHDGKPNNFFLGQVGTNKRWWTRWRCPCFWCQRGMTRRISKKAARCVENFGRAAERFFMSKSRALWAILVVLVAMIFFFQKYWVANHPNWLSYFSEGVKPPTTLAIFEWIVIGLSLDCLHFLSHWIVIPCMKWWINGECSWFSWEFSSPSWSHGVYRWWKNWCYM